MVTLHNQYDHNQNPERIALYGYDLFMKCRSRTHPGVD